MPERRDRVRFLCIGIRVGSQQKRSPNVETDEEVYAGVLHVHLELWHPAAVQSSQRDSNHLHSDVSYRS
jgi:hypothetical protein